MLNFLKKKNIVNEVIDKNNLPCHIAVIMDGNGRWAKKRNLPRTIGHKAGVEAIRDIVKECSSLGIKVLTVYAFSTENWKRPTNEVNNLMSLLVDYLKKEVIELNKNNVKIKAIGDLKKLPIICQNELQNAFNTTANNKGLILNLALNYGGRAEIVNTTKIISNLVLENKIKIDDINEETLSKYMWTSDLPDPDLIIRPSGELRLSNFLLWQCAYSEFWYSDIYWPDFKKEDLHKAIIDYQNRDRRRGGLSLKK